MRPAWVKRQIDDFVAGFCARATLIGVAGLEELRRAHPGLPGWPGGIKEAMGNLDEPEGFIWRPFAGQGLPQLWLAPTKTGYRAAFERFARQELGAAGLDGADVQIDHVFPKRAGSLGGLGYVRMLAIPPESNMAAGRTLEKVMVARNEELGPRGKATRVASYFSIGKATGFDGYETLPDDTGAGNRAMVAALMAYLRRWGLPPGVLTALDQRLTEETAGRLR
jgi:hypothetical protein